MADRTVTARLRLVHAEFTKGTRTAAKDVEELGHKISQTSTRTKESWQELGKRTSALGDSMTTRITLPLLALGGAAVKMSNDFSGVFTQMEATAGVAEDEVAGLKDEVLGLAGETGRAPQELAEALLLIRSSGFAGKEAMDVLAISAKGAAAGMGETAEIANAITNVVNGYGQANITAAEAMDVLTASVKEGKAEAADMAPQFGRLVPLAAELKIKFSDVGGTLAYLTKATGDAAQSSTALQGIMSKLLRPSQQGAEALKEIGIQGNGVRQMLAEKGLLGTLETLRKQLGQSGFQLLFDDVQALNGALQITGPGLEDARQVIDNVGDSAGAADEAFGKWAKSMGAQNSRAWATAQAAMIEFGDTLMPMVAQMSDLLTGLLDAFMALPKPVQELLAVVGLTAAAMGPLVKAGGNLMQVWGGLKGMTGDVAGGFFATSAAAAVLTVTIGALVYGLMNIAKESQEEKKRIEDFADALKEGGNKARVAADELITTRLTAGKLGDQLHDAGADLGLFVDQVRSGADETKELDEKLRGVAWDQMSTKLDEVADSGNEFAQQIREIADASDMSTNDVLNLLHTVIDLSDEYDKGRDRAQTNADAQEEVADSAADAGLAIDEQGNIVDATSQKIEDLTSALDELLGKYLTVDESIRRQNELIVGLGAHFDEMSEKYKGHALDLDMTTEAGIKNSDMLDDLVQASSDTISKMIEQGSTSEDLRKQWQSDRGELALVIEKFRSAGQDVSKYDELLGEIDTFVATTIATPGLDGANSGLDSLHTKIRQIDGSTVTVNVNTRHTTSTGRMGGVPLFHEGGVVPGRRGEEVAAVLLAGERVLSLDDPINKALSSPMVSANSLGGGAATNVINIDLRGAVTPDSRQLVRLVTYALNRGIRTTRGVNAAA